MAHLWARWLRNPCRLGDPLRFKAGGQNQKWPTCGHGGYVTPAVSGIPTASKRRGGGAKSQVGYLWARWLCHPCHLRDPHRFKAGGGGGGGGGGGSEVAHFWARWLRNPCRLGDPHRFTAGGQNQKWPTCGQGGYVTPAVSGIPTASKRGGGGGQNQKWPTCGQGGYVTPAASGIPCASERGDKIRSGPLVGKVATSPLPSWGSPPLQSRGGGAKIRSGPLVGKVAT